VDVIGAGFGRTGTLSVKVALEALGFGPCYHMVEVFEHPEHIPAWQAAAEGAPVDWGTVFAGYRATVDWPGCTFYESLLREYPRARVLLTVRDPERWYESAAATIYQANRAAVRAGEEAPAHVPAAGRMIDTLIWRRTFGGRFEDKAQAIACFERHNREVQERVPAERLLVYDVAEGWAPLCRFLGVPVPEGRPFPHLNDRAAFGHRVGQLVRPDRPGGPPPAGPAGPA
jgi:Sulfotransferase domain